MAAATGNFLRRFGTAQPSHRDEIKLDLMKIQKKIDVKKLKHQLWTFINPKIEHTKGMKESLLSKPAYEGKRHHAPEQEEQPEKNGEHLKMSQMMGNLYGDHHVDAENISVHSAFICLLHIANEKGLALLTDDHESDLKIFKAVL